MPPKSIISSGSEETEATLGNLILLIIELLLTPQRQTRRVRLTPRGKPATLELASYHPGTTIVLVLEILVLKSLVQVSHLMIVTQKCLFSSYTFAPSRITTWHHCPQER